MVSRRGFLGALSLVVGSVLLGVKALLPRCVVVGPGDDLQAAVDGLGSGGGTVYLRPGVYDPPVYRTGNRVAIIGSRGALAVRGGGCDGHYRPRAPGNGFRG